MMNDVIIGKRVILFPLEQADLAHFVELHRADKKGYLLNFCLREMTDEEATKYIAAMIMTHQIKIWTVVTKEGKASRRGGYMYLSDISSLGCNISGIMDKDFTHGLAKQLRKGKNTFSQDALHTLLGFCFLKLNFHRVASDVLDSNKLSQKLLKKEGFVKEGVMREGINIDDKYHDVFSFSILDNEFKSQDIKMLQNEHIASIIEEHNVKQEEIAVN